MPFPTAPTNELERLQHDISCHAENNGEEFYEAVNDLIQQAEERIWTESDGVVGFQREDLVAFTPNLAVQSIFPPGNHVVINAIRYLSEPDSKIDYLQNKNESWLEELNREAPPSKPRFYSPTGEESGNPKILLAPRPDYHYEAVVEYTTFDSLIDNPDGTWLSNNAWDVLFYASLYYCYGFLKADLGYIKMLEEEYSLRRDQLLLRMLKKENNTNYKYQKG